MKNFLIAVNIAIVCYGIHLISVYDPARAAINRVVFEVVTDMQGTNDVLSSL